jgi:hypothetical protein
MAEGLGASGQMVQGLAAIDRALVQSERNEERWYLPELLRIRGELLLLEGASSLESGRPDSTPGQIPPLARSAPRQIRPWPDPPLARSAPGQIRPWPDSAPGQIPPLA